MNGSDLLAELDIAVMQTRRAVREGMLPDNEYTKGLHDSLAAFRKYVRSEKYARLVRMKSNTNKETPTNAS